MKKKIIKVISVLMAISVVFLITILIQNKFIDKKETKEDKIKKLINVSKLDQKFIDDYFEDYKEMTSKNNEENILIVISDKGIKDNYGASQVVNAPNHQYFLQYETEQERKEAYKKLKQDNYLSVEENGY